MAGRREEEQRRKGLEMRPGRYVVGIRSSGLLWLLKPHGIIENHARLGEGEDS